MSQLAERLRKVANEVPAVAAALVALLTALATFLDVVGAEGAVVGGAAAGLLAAVRLVVSPAYPQGADRARMQALRFDMLALEQMAKEGDEDAAAILVTLKSHASDSTPV